MDFFLITSFLSICTCRAVLFLYVVISSAFQGQKSQPQGMQPLSMKRLISPPRMTVFLLLLYQYDQFILYSNFLTYQTWVALTFYLEVRYNDTIRKFQDSTASILFLTESLFFLSMSVISQKSVMSMCLKFFYSLSPKASFFNMTIWQLSLSRNQKKFFFALFYKKSYRVSEQSCTKNMSGMAFRQPYLNLLSLLNASRNLNQQNGQSTRLYLLKDLLDLSASFKSWLYTYFTKALQAKKSQVLMYSICWSNYYLVSFQTFFRRVYSYFQYDFCHSALNSFSLMPFMLMVLKPASSLKRGECLLLLNSFSTLPILSFNSIFPLSSTKSGTPLINSSNFFPRLFN